MLTTETFEQFTIYKSECASSFIYANFDKSDLFMDGLADYILSEGNLLNYANTMTPIEFVATPKIYKKLYATISSFLNSELELLTFDNITEDVRNVLGEEYKFVDSDGKTLVQKDKVGKIGEYIFHVLLSSYYKYNCILPKFRCTTDRNMSVFGIDTLFFDSVGRKILFGESKFCTHIDNAITLINRSLLEYASQISEEYKLVLSNDECFALSGDFLHTFQEHTSICMTFEEFIKSASIEKICVPTFIAHGSSAKKNTPEHYLERMNKGINQKAFFGLETEYILISLPVIDKAKMMDIIMRKVVRKSNEYGARQTTI